MPAPPLTRRRALASQRPGSSRREGWDTSAEAAASHPASWKRPAPSPCSHSSRSSPPWLLENRGPHGGGAQTEVREVQWRGESTKEGSGSAMEGFVPYPCCCWWYSGGCGALLAELMACGCLFSPRLRLRACLSATAIRAPAGPISRKNMT